jgi:hypothetical protein
MILLGTKSSLFCIGNNAYIKNLPTGVLLLIGHFKPNIVLFQPFRAGAVAGYKKGILNGVYEYVRKKTKNWISPLRQKQQRHSNKSEKW